MMMRTLAAAPLLLAAGIHAQGSRIVSVTTGPAPGNYVVIDTPVNNVLSYHYVANRTHWDTAVTLCPYVNPNYVGLARFYNDYEWNLLAQAIDNGFRHGDTYSLYSGATYFQGAWIGLSSPAPYPTGITPASPGAGPWTPVASWPDWQWVDGTNRHGQTMDPSSYPATKWGGTITAFNSDVCGYFNPIAGSGFVAGLTDPCATTWDLSAIIATYQPQAPPAGCCANARSQPDNSGGFQRCVLVAAGTNNQPVTGATIFLDDQTCRPQDQPLPNGNLQHFICESRTYSPPPPPPVAIVFDPHLFLPHGGRADFRGEDNTWCNMLSTKELSVNMLFTDADFHLIKPDKQLIHGSRMQALGATIKTSTGKTLLVSYNSTWNDIHRATVRDATGINNPRDFIRAPVIAYVVSTTDPATPGHGAKAMAYHRSKTIDNVHLSMERKQVAGMKAVALTIDTGKWEVVVASLPFPNPKDHPNKALLNLKIDAKEGYDPDHDMVAPHGIIGQSYDGDGVGVDGAVDDYKAGGNEVTTKAMAEGAIEGEHADYKMGGPWATEFKYARYGRTAARPRDVGTLRGKKVHREKPAQGFGGTADVAPSAEDMAEAGEAEAAAVPPSRRLEEQSTSEKVLAWLRKLWHSVVG